MLFWLGLAIGFVLGGGVTFVFAVRLFCLPVINRCDELEADNARLKRNDWESGDVEIVRG